MSTLWGTHRVEGSAPALGCYKCLSPPCLTLFWHLRPNPTGWPECKGQGSHCDLSPSPAAASRRGQETSHSSRATANWPWPNRVPQVRWCKCQRLWIMTETRNQTEIEDRSPKRTMKEPQPSSTTSGPGASLPYLWESGKSYWSAALKKDCVYSLHLVSGGS